jgi:hypothetical protein
LSLKEKQQENNEKQDLTDTNIISEEEIVGPSTSTFVQSSSTAATNVVNAESSDSDESLDDLMSCGPLKKKVKLVA